MIQVCMDCDIIYGEKEPYKDKSHTHGLCPKCFEIRMEELEGRRDLKKVERRLTNMPGRVRPKVGDFILFEDDIWILRKIKGNTAHVESWATGDVEELFIKSFESTTIRTWEVQ